MLASALLLLIRDQLRDTVADGSGNYRWSDAKLFRYMTSGRQLIVSAHPESQYSADVDNPVLADITTGANDLGLDVGWTQALVHYVCHMCFGEDADDAGNQKLAVYHYELFRKEME